MTVNDLPPEVLGEIFLLATVCVPLALGQKFHTGYIIRSSDGFCPLNLVHVCRYWRAVAFSMQSLWTSFCGDEFTPDSLAHWLSFSQSSALHFALSPMSRLGWMKGIDDSTLKASKAMIHQFSLYSDRWDSLYFNLGYFEVTEALADMLQASALQSPLQKLEITFWRDNTPQKIIENLISAIASFPSVRYFGWTFNCRQGTLPHAFPWHGLEDVYVDASIEVEEFIWCLMQCTSARIVTFRGRGWDNKRRVTGAINNIHSTLTKLESLNIDQHCDPSRFLQFFTLPSLVSLEIQGLERPSSVFQRFFVRSQCPLTRFTVDDTRFSLTDDEIVECLSIPYLRSTPEVSVTINYKPKTYLQSITDVRPRILDDFPGIATWHDRMGRRIGWRNKSG